MAERTKVQIGLTHVNRFLQIYFYTLAFISLLLSLLENGHNLKTKEIFCLHTTKDSNLSPLSNPRLASIYREIAMFAS